MYNYTQKYIQSKDGIFYFVRRVPVDVQPYYSSKRISFSLKTRSFARAMRACNSILQRLEDYWLGLRLRKMDIPAIHLVRSDATAEESNGIVFSKGKSRYNEFNIKVSTIDIVHRLERAGRIGPLSLNQNRAPSHRASQ